MTHSSRRSASLAWRLCAVAPLAAAALALAVPPAPGQTGAGSLTTLGFDDVVAGTTIDTEYALRGVRFGVRPAGFSGGPFVATARLQARSAPNVAAFAYDPGTDFSSSWITFDRQ